MNQEREHYPITTIWQCNTVGISQGEVNLSGAFVHLTKGTGVENRMAKQSLLKNRRLLQGSFECFGSIGSWNIFKTKGWCPRCNSTFLLWFPPFSYSHQRIPIALSNSQLAHWFQSPLNCTSSHDGSFFHLSAPRALYCMHSCDCNSPWHSPTECWLWAFRKIKS